MPRFDGTGPLGYGPGTGRGLGPCSAGIGWRRGFGRGYGRFWGWGPYNAPYRMTQKEETETLKDEAEILEEELKEIKERLAGLKAKK